MKFPKENRLLSREEFQHVFDMAHRSVRTQSGKRILRADPYIVYSTGSNTAARLGLSIARRVIRKAHDRNRIKRCLREYFRLHRDELSGDFVIRIAHRPKSFDFSTLTQPLAALRREKR